MKIGTKIRGMRTKILADSLSRRALPLRYGVAVASVAVALALKLLLDPLITAPSPFLLLAGAVMVGAWFGGLGPGLLATAFGALVADYFFLAPVGSFTGLGLSALPLVLFAVQGLLISLLAHALRSARERAEASMLETQMNQEDLRRSEERFRLLVEGVEDYAIFMLDSEGRIVSWNAGARRVMGYDAQEVGGEHFSCFFLLEDVRSGRPDEELRVARDVGQFQGEGRRIRKDGSHFWADVVVTALRGESGKLRGFAKIVRDVTDRKRAEDALRRSLDALLALYETGQVLSASLEREEIGLKLLEIMRRLSGIRAASIHLLDGNGPLERWRTSGPEELLASVSGDPEVEAARRYVLKTGKPRALELSSQEPEASSSLTGVILPLRVRSRTIGMVEAYGPEELAEKETIETFASLASQAASAFQNARLYEELSEREERLEELVGKLITAQEEERHRVAYEIHDGLTQVAVAAYQYLQDFADEHPPQSVRGEEELNEAIGLVRRTVGEARRVIANLRPTALDDLGLAVAVGQQVEQLRAEGFRVDYEENLKNERLPTALETALFRIAQEALTNARKHAQGAPVRIALKRSEGSMRLEVQDWGPGFRPETAGRGGGPGERVGLSSMRERAALLGGELVIRSEPGAGTLIVADIPLSAEGG